MGHITTTIGYLFRTVLRGQYDEDLSYHAMERLCLEQARLCGLPESRVALEELARNYRAADVTGF
jgi:hypothetical protein